MFDSERDTLKRGEQHVILQEYNDIVEELKRELEICKTEQNGIRSQLQSLHVETKDSSDTMRDYISHIHLEECGDGDTHNKMITNLKERIAALQAEKDSAVQLWQVSMKAVDALEQELRTRPVDSKDVKFYEEQLKDVRQSYSEAIKALESKLLQAKENFTKQQSLWVSSKETIETLKWEKQELTKKLQESQQDAQQRDRTSQQRIQSLTDELSAARAETQRMDHSKSDLEKKLNESRRVAGNILAKNEETKCKMAEALDLIESAVREKDFALQREAQVAEQKAKLEARLASIAEEHVGKTQSEIARLKDAHEHNVRKYQVEIKELKSELREKATLLDRSQRESRLAEEELERVRRDSEDLLAKSAAKLLNFEQALKQADSKLDACNETAQSEKRYSSEMRQLREKIAGLEEKLAVSSEKLRQIQQQSVTDDRVRSADEKTKDAIDRYANLERQLTRATDDKESLTAELKSLQSAFDREIHKRDYERRALENRIRELEANAMENESGVGGPPIVQRRADTTNKHTLDIRVENIGHNWKLLLSEQLSKQREDFDKKMKEMTQHVTIHQKISNEWREEAKALTARFRVKSKELRGKILLLREENAELQKALVLCRQQFTQYRTCTLHRYVYRKIFKLQLRIRMYIFSHLFCVVSVIYKGLRPGDDVLC
ncbi:PREDICTED: myosin heavy chain, non-muscle-like isoform X2 [Dinoponera quadriceps]|uniref:Myosin heavy chain, non-muscle-like isoform X2 n=1 Tax=Dinoponera quadriceps TaxID=609295 RepID=A0A6P3Y2L4_DINQU|nr:PREDICTED: myosin heavy chain, non-muscle-like isoform X2 [Dinoponera quadriceps]